MCSHSRAMYSSPGKNLLLISHSYFSFQQAVYQRRWWSRFCLQRYRREIGTWKYYQPRMSEARKDNILLGEKKKGNISTLLYICYIYVSKREKRLYRHAQSLWFWSSGSCAGPCDWPLMMLFHWTENSRQPCLIRAATTWALGTAPHGYSHALVLLWVFFFLSTR